jgi:CRP-like cAMP-binding protein
MLFPGSRIWYEGSAADLAALTEEIKSSAFSGHIVLEFQESLDVIVCVGGEFLKVIEKIGRRLLSTKKYREIWGKCQIKPGRMVVFELPEPLARRLRGVHDRRLICSGTATTGCDPERLLGERRAAAFTGLLDCVSPQGKLLLDYESGAIVACYYTEYEGLVLEGLEAFRAWHRGFLSSKHPSFVFLSEVGGGDGAQLWDEILMDYADQIPLPLRSSLERLERGFGRRAATGDELFSRGVNPGKALYLLSGRVQLLTDGPAAPVPCGSLLPGSIVGLEWIFGISLPHSTGKAAEASRFLAFDRAELPLLLRNSPVLASRCVREAIRLLLGRRTRLDAYRKDPRLRDLEQAVEDVLLGRVASGGAVPAAEVFRELTQRLPLSLPEIDTLFRTLAALGGVRQSAGHISLEHAE